jgi:signal transduction histidine kinase
MLSAVFILLISSLSYYVIIRNILIQQIDNNLKVEEEEIMDYVGKNNSLPNESSYKGQEIRFKKTNSIVKRHFESTAVAVETTQEKEPVRQLLFPITVSGELYTAIVRKSQEEAEDLIRLIFFVTAVIFILLLLIIAFVNRFILLKLWQPFYNTLQQLTSFNVNDTHSMHLVGSKVDEFNELNTSVIKMADRVTNEFNSLKSFTENASHEMQTPLAVINSKLDLLIQHSNESQAEQLQAIYDSVSRLNKLNRTLLLLTKIDNRLYPMAEEITIKKLLEQKLQQLEDLIQSREITVTTHLENVSLHMNYDLADILLNNLLNNAIKHNIKGGTIECTLSNDHLFITNTGLANSFDDADIFERFQKGAHSDGTGLGLAVVKQICVASNFSISYKYEFNLHHIQLYFNRM